MRRTDFERLAATILALLIQIAAVVLFTIGEMRKAPISEPGNELVYIQAIQMPEPDTLSSASRSTNPTLLIPKAETMSTPPDIAQQANVAVPSILPIDVPTIDWDRSLRDTARRFVDNQAALESHGRTLDSKPQVLVLPDASKQPHKAGDTEHFEGGRVITWLNERCYKAAEPLAPSKVVCKVRSLEERLGEALAEGIEKEVKPKYLSRPLPEPTPPQSSFEQAQRDQPYITIDQ